MRMSDWSSDVCSSDLPETRIAAWHVCRRSDRHRRATTLSDGAANRDCVQSLWRDGVRRDHGRQVQCRCRREGQSRGREVAGSAGREQWRSGAETGGRSEEHTSELQSLMRISYAVFCLIKKKITISLSEQYNIAIYN